MREGIVIGQRLGHYRILERLGGGGMGEVFLGEDATLGRKVALKFLHREGSANANSERRERFLLEAKAASALDHPNICTIYEIDETGDGRMFIVMAYYDGETLKEHIRRGPLAIERAVDFATQVAEGLLEAHRNQIVHRDIKPANLMVTPRGRVKIVDFGLAKLLGGDALTRTGATLGTVSYMSPEQTSGEPVDLRTDIWSLGVVLHEMVTGELPFRGEHPQAIAHAILHEEPPPLSARRDSVSQELEQIVAQALSKAPSQRYQSMAELLDELRNIVPETGSALETAERRTASVESSRKVSPGTSKTVGRDRERQSLRQELEAVAQGGGRILCVAGEAGLGKTTLIEGFLSEVSEGDVSFKLLRGRCSERLAGADAYLPILEALKGLLLEGRASTLALELKSLAPTWYVQVAPDDPSAARMAEEAPSGSQERRKLELSAFLREVSRHRALILFIDDLHWADASTVDLLVYLAAKFDSLRILVLLSYRPAELKLASHPFLKVQADLQARGVCREMPLEFLSREELERYLELQFPGHDFPMGFSELLHTRTEGSPLFMVGLLGYLRDAGVIARETDRWALTRSIPDLAESLPESVRGMIQRKTDQLSGAERQLLQAASVQGFELDSAVMARALELDAEEVEELLDRLDRVHSFVQLVGEKEFPDGTLTLRYRFVHVLYQNALDRSLRPTRRATVARRVAEALLKFHGDELASVVADLAVLFETAREFARAADFYLRSARSAAGALAFQEAAMLARRGLDCVRMPTATEADENTRALLQITFDENRGDACNMAGERDEARVHYQQALDHASKEDAIPRARLYRKVGKSWQLQHDFDAALKAHALADETLGAGTRSSRDVWREWIEIQLERMELHYFANQLHEMNALVEKARTVVENHGTPGQRARFSGSLGLAGLRRDRYVVSDETLSHVTAALAASRLSHDLGQETWCLFLAGFAHLWRGELDEAEENMQASLELTERIGDMTTRTRCLTYLTVLFRKRAEIDKVQEYAARSLEAATKTGMVEYIATAKGNEAWTAWRNRDLATTRERAREARELWRQLPGGHASAGFIWIGLLPLIAATLDSENLTEAAGCAQELLSGSMMRLPDRLTRALEEAVSPWEQGSTDTTRTSLKRVVELACETGFM